MFHVKHSAFSCFLPLFFSVFSSLFQPVLFRFFLPLCSARCFFLLFTLFLGRFFAFCASRVIFGRVFLDLGVAFCPFFFFSRSHFIFFRNFCGFRLALPVLSGRAAVFLSFFYSFSFFSFTFCLVFSFFASFG